MMEERRKVKGKHVSKYNELDNAIRQKCREQKEAWWNKQCDEIEREFYRNPSVAHIKGKKLAGKIYCSSSGCLKSKIGTMILEKEDILSRWEEYIGDRFEDDRRERPETNKEMEEPPSLKDEIESSLTSIKNGTATRPDNISVEILYVHLKSYSTRLHTTVLSNYHTTITD